MKLLIIEDERELSDSMVAYLEGEQYLCETACDFASAREKIELYQYDCILLDISLPGGSGLNLLRELKVNDQSDGVIIISARDSLDDKIKGLESGADDYLAKPFHLSELGARVSSIIRRKNFGGRNLIILNDLTIDLNARSVVAHGQELPLTPKEYDLLLFLAANKNKVVSKNAIAMHLLGDEAEWLLQHDIVYAHIKNLRKKLDDAGCSDYIQSRYGVGYKIQVP
jgi:DNA-binding response OmpR family regulator